ncbi:MAG: 3-hydroxyacyl-[acyl-carrier-protein] dehydratase FabZ, partial [Wolbachia pipientis]|nr:3-hydroxyacyl-[acyl-carrier-protein] dehydratase FabZ [Wolbachia pipientis]
MIVIMYIIKRDPGKNIKAIKNVAFNEPFFVGHFSHHPIMLGVLIVESLAQASAICILGGKRSQNIIKNTIIYFMSIKNAKFRK